jgi:hypothetical protein
MILIHLSCIVTESLRILRFVSDHSRLSALWSHSSWPNHSWMRSHENWGFECWLSHASHPVYFWLSVWAVRCHSHLAQPCDVFDSWGKDVVCTNETNATEVIFHYMKCIWVHNAVPWLKYWPNEPMQQAIDKIVQKKLPTKKVLTSHHSRSFELQSHLVTTVCMTWVESLWLLHKDPHRLGKACASL